MNTGIPMMGQQPDVLSIVDNANTAAQRSLDFQNQNALRAFLQDQGPQVLAGDQNALAALSRFDQGLPLALNIRGNQQAQAQAQIDALSAQDRERMLGIARGAMQFVQAGDAEGYARWFAMNGENEVPPMEMFPAIAAQLGLEVGGPRVPDSFQTLDMRARAAGLEPGTPEYQEFMRRGGAGNADGDQRDRRIADTAASILADGIRTDPTEARMLAQGLVDGIFEMAPDGRVIDKRQQGESVVDIPPGRSSIPSDIEPTAALGGGGFLRNIANTVTDAIGMGSAFPETERATQAWRILQNETMIALASDVSGRPSNFLLERFEGLTVNPNSIFAGEARARERVERMLGLLDQALDYNQTVLNSRVMPSDRSQAEQTFARLRDLRESYQNIYDKFDAAPRGGASAAGSSPVPEIPAIMEAAERHNISAQAIWDNLAPEVRERMLAEWNATRPVVEVDATGGSRGGGEMSDDELLRRYGGQ